MALADFQRVIKEAVAYFARRGYTSKHDLDSWSGRIEEAARSSFVDPKIAGQMIARHLGSIYNRATRRIPSALDKMHKRFARAMTPEMYFRRVETFPQLQTKMRNELDRRIQAATDLIELQRDEAVTGTLRRFKGWVSSVPQGGTPTPVAEEIKPYSEDVKTAKFQVNRLNIDQGHKLAASLNATYAEGTGAIAAKWHSNWRENPTRKKGGYQWRPDHKDRDQGVYTIRNNWAEEKGLMQPGPAGYTDQITQPAEEVYCRCYYEYIYNLIDLPQNMLTGKAKKALGAMEDSDEEAV
jgi:hypothetical protein